MDSHEIKRVAKEYKNKNGNSTVTNNELLWYNVHRVDEIQKEMTTKNDCSEHRKQINTNKSHTIAITSVIVAALALLTSIAAVVAASQG